MPKKSQNRRAHKTVAKKISAAVVNRRAGFDYDLSENLVVGLELTGAETKAARLGRVNLRGSYVVPRANNLTKRAELFLINASFSLATNAPKGSGEKAISVDTRARKILAKRKQIDEFVAKKAAGFSLIPTKLLPRGRFVKLEIALGKGKKNYDKRETIRRKDLARENAKFAKNIR